jgi:Putative porin
MKTRWLPVCVLSALALGVASHGSASELDDVRSLRDTTIALINSLVKQGVLTREKADELIHQAEQVGKGGASTPAVAAASAAGAGAAAAAGPNAGAGASGAASQTVAPGVVRVPYVPESVKQEIREEIEKDVLAQAKHERWGDPGALPEWLGRLNFAGDIRLRGQADRFPNGSPPNASPLILQDPAFGAYNINNTTDARNRLRFRARFGVEASLGKTVTAGVRLATGGVGAGSDPTSENQTLGNYNTRNTIGVDRAYITYYPFTWLYFNGGRIGNPFYSPTSLVWADDLSLEGLVLGFKPYFGRFQPYAIAGAFPIQDVEPTLLTRTRSKWMYGYQTGLNVRLAPSTSLKFGAALYDYKHLEGTPNPNVVSTDYSLTAAPFRQKGNSVFDINRELNTQNGTQNYLIGLTSKFKELNVSGSLDVSLFGSKHIVVDADWVKNLGFDHDEIFARTGIDLQERTKGMQGRITFGDTTFIRRNTWQGFVGYRHVERDAVVDGFTDSDFRLGGTDAKGFFVGGRYGFEKNTTIGARWFSGKQIDGLPLAIDVLQIDMIAAF